MVSSLRRLNPYIWRYRWRIGPGLLFALASAIFSLIVPGVVREIIDAVPRMVAMHELWQGTPAGAELFSNFRTALVLAGGAIVLLSITSGAFMYLMRLMVVVASRHIEFDLRGALYGHLQTLSGGFYTKNATGDLMTRATSDIEKVRRYVGPALMYLARAFTAIVAALTFMFLISPTLTFWALLPMPVLAVAVWIVSRMVHERTDRQQQAYSGLTSRVQEALSGIRVVKAYAQEQAWAERVEESSDLYRDRALALARVDVAFRPILVLLIGLSTLLVVGVGGQLVIQGQLTLGNIAEFIIYVAILTWPVAAFGYTVSLIQQATASLNRLARVFDTKPDVTDTARTDDAIQDITGRITFDDVSFRYGADEIDALRNVSFDLEAGKTLGIVGRTGSGKSTLIEMIPRLIEPTEGAVRIDGRDIREIPLETLRGAIGYVPQEVFLFSDTVGNNIAFGEMDSEEEAIRRAAVEADLLSNVEEFQNGFETRVGERGITLSGGQKQRTAIARALIRQPAILIFDDALSAVDTQTESRILSSLRRQFGLRTCVVVSHRISAVQAADLILVLDEGRVAERGDHESLLLEGGLYANLYHKQQLEAELAEA